MGLLKKGRGKVKIVVVESEVQDFLHSEPESHPHAEEQPNTIERMKVFHEKEATPQRSTKVEKEVPEGENEVEEEVLEGETEMEKELPDGSHEEEGLRSSPPRKKKRGLTKMKQTVKDPTVRELLNFTDMGEPYGPTLVKLASYVGTLVREHVPITVSRLEENY